jgi:hypothetical protein
MVSNEKSTSLKHFDAANRPKILPLCMINPAFIEFLSKKQSALCRTRSNYAFPNNYACFRFVSGNLQRKKHRAGEMPRDVDYEG